jgi:hypothetical protein
MTIGLKAVKKFNSKSLCYRIVYKTDGKRPRWVPNSLLDFDNPLKSFSFRNALGFDGKMVLWIRLGKNKEEQIICKI